MFLHCGQDFVKRSISYLCTYTWYFWDSAYIYLVWLPIKSRNCANGPVRTFFAFIMYQKQMHMCRKSEHEHKTKTFFTSLCWIGNLSICLFPGVRYVAVVLLVPGKGCANCVLSQDNDKHVHDSHAGISAVMTRFLPFVSYLPWLTKGSSLILVHLALFSKYRTRLNRASKVRKSQTSSFTIEHLALKEREGLLGKAKMLVGAWTCWLAF